MTNTIQSTGIAGSNSTGILTLATNDELFILPGVVVSNSFASVIGGAVAMNGGLLLNQGALVGALSAIGGPLAGTVTNFVTIQSGGSASGNFGIYSALNTATWKTTVAAGGSMVGGQDGINVLGPTVTYVAGTLSGSANDGINFGGSGAVAHSLQVDSGGRVRGGATGVASTDTSATWNVSVLSNGSISGGTDGLNLLGASQVYTSGSVSGGTGAGIAVGGSSAVAESLTVDAGGLVEGGTNGVSSSNASASWNVSCLANGSIVGAGNGLSLNGDARVSVAGSVYGGGFGIAVINATGRSYDVSVASGGSIMGGATGIVDTSNSEFNWNIQVAAGGTISGKSTGINLNYPVNLVNRGLISGNGAFAIESGGGTVYNFGTMESLVGSGYFTDGSLTLYNYGVVSGGDNAIDDSNTSFSDTCTIYNFGTIVSPNYCFSDGSLANDKEIIYNAGSMVGLVQLGHNSSNLFDSTLGTVQGAILINGGSATVVAGQTGGQVIGGGGADLLYANPTANAAANRAQTSLSGGAGNNALYGDGAFTTFLAGNDRGGTNQIWGGASQMSGVAGYANNTLSFETSLNIGVFVDLLIGHNAYVSSGVNWTGTGVFEDWIAATASGLSTVPNVIGSTVADTIRCDNGVDQIAGGGGADSLYAGSGASSQDTFIYRGYGDSNLVGGYDTIVGFKAGIDKIDVSAVMSANGLGPTSLAISTNGTSNTVYIEKTPGTVNSATDLALIVNTSAAGGLHTSDFIL